MKVTVKTIYTTMRLNFKLLVLFCLLLSACGTHVPETDFKQPILLDEDAAPAPMMFTRLQVDLPAGKNVGTITDNSIGSLIFVSLPAGRHDLQAGLSRKEQERIFADVMEGLGYDVVDTIDVVFSEEIEDEILRTEYRVGGKIIDAVMNADIDGHSRFVNFVYGNSGLHGTLYLKIKWGVYDALRRTVVYQTVTEGTGISRTPDPEGMTLMINAAFEMAAHNLAADETFYNLLVHGQRPDWNPRRKQDKRPLKYDANEEVRLAAAPLSQTPLSANVAHVKNAAVMVQAGAGHGSGFFISPQGHILTNHHVVGNAQRVRIVTSGKQDILVAQVLRTVPARDVALLKLEELTPGLEITTLPLREEWPAVSEEVYAIGAPIRTSLQDTLSKGIISAHRKGFKLFGTRVDIMQADVDIHGGNSGGPLLDRHGNIVAMSVAGTGRDDYSTGLNYFIPIAGALAALDIEHAGHGAQPAEAPVSLTP